MRSRAWIILIVAAAVVVVLIAKQSRRPPTLPEPVATAQSPQPQPRAPEAVPEPAPSVEPADQAPPPANPPASGPPSPAPSPQPAPDQSAKPLPPAPQPPPSPEPAEQTHQASSEPVEPLPGSKLAESLQNGLPTMADFGAGWCKTCKRMEPVLDQAAAKYGGKANIVYVDVTYYPEIAKQYKIRLIPTQIFFDSDGKEVFRNTGFFPIENIDLQLRQLGVRP